jgi:hypothetical protein
VSKQQQGFPVSTGGKQKREKRRAKMTLGLINANPVVHAKKERVARTEDLHGDDAVDPLEIYDILFSLFSLSLSLSFFAASKSSVILYLLLFIQQIGDLWLELVNFVRDIRDPEHPYSLEQLSVLSEESITVDDKLGRILWVFVELQFHCFDFESNWCYLEIEIYDWKYVPNMSKIE